MKLLKKLQQLNRAIILMKIYIDSYKNLVIITPPRAIRADLPIKIKQNYKAWY